MWLCVVFDDDELPCWWENEDTNSLITHHDQQVMSWADEGREGSEGNNNPEDSKVTDHIYRYTIDQAMVWPTTPHSSTNNTFNHSRSSPHRHGGHTLLSGISINLWTMEWWLMPDQQSIYTMMSRKQTTNHHIWHHVNDKIQGQHQSTHITHHTIIIAITSHTYAYVTHTERIHFGNKINTTHSFLHSTHL